MKNIMKNIKKLIVIFSAAFLFVSLFTSCRTYGITYEDGKSWSLAGIQNGEILGTLKIGVIEVDKLGGSASIEREIRAILPLVFWELGFVFEPSSAASTGMSFGNADYIVDVSARERDITYGWKTKKSISLEVILLPVQTVRFAGTEGVRTPFAAGRTVITGTAGLSVSGNIENILRKTAKKAVEAVRTAAQNEAF